MTRSAHGILAELEGVSLAPVVDDGEECFTGVLTPERWRTRCRGSAMCGVCYLCRQAIAIKRAAFIRPWDDRDGARGPRLPEDHTFPCVEAALAALVRTWDVERGTPSPIGPMLDRVRLQMTGGMGEGYQGAHKGSREHRSIEDLAEVDRAFRQAYRSHHDAGAVSEEKCQVVLVLSLVGRPIPLGTPPKKGRPRAKWTQEWGREPMRRHEVAEALELPVAQVKRLVKHGRQEMIKPLAGAGVIPMPRPSEGLHEAVQDWMEQRARPAGR